MFLQKLNSYLQELQSKAEQGRPDLPASQALPVSSVGLVETEKTVLQGAENSYLLFFNVR